MSLHPARAITMTIALLAVTTASASARPTPPRILKVSALDAKRITPKSGASYYSLSAVVKLSRSLTQADRTGGGLGLIASLWATRDHLDPGTELPDELFAGSSLGRVGRTSSHCYRAEVAQLSPHHAVRPGRSWRVALHDGHHVLRLAPRTTLAKSTKAAEARQLSSLGC
jgi:hypothetical protein